MADRDLDRLEAEVEAARRRVAADLEKVGAPGSFSELRRNLGSEVSEAREELTDKIKASARDAATGVIDGIKARAAANPVAALAITAGLAWRLAHHPPIASVLIGAGLVGLMRADPRRPGIGAEGLGRARAVADNTRARMAEWSAGDPAARLGEAVDGVKDAAGRMGSAVVEATKRSAGQLADAIEPRAERAIRMVDHAVRDPEERNKVLLGAAAVAVAAAVGIAYQRRMR
jgi:hypothetical protein